MLAWKAADRQEATSATVARKPGGSADRAAGNWLHMVAIRYLYVSMGVSKCEVYAMLMPILLYTHVCNSNKELDSQTPHMG